MRDLIKGRPEALNPLGENHMPLDFHFRDMSALENSPKISERSACVFVGYNNSRAFSSLFYGMSQEFFILSL